MFSSLLCLGSSVQKYVHDPKLSLEDFQHSLIHTAALVAPSFLPTLTEWGEGSVTYNPHRVMRQFGYDQGVPAPSIVMPEDRVVD